MCLWYNLNITEKLDNVFKLYILVHVFGLHGNAKNKNCVPPTYLLTSHVMKESDKLHVLRE